MKVRRRTTCGNEERMKIRGKEKEKAMKEGMQNSTNDGVHAPNIDEFKCQSLSFEICETTRIFSPNFT